MAELRDNWPFFSLCFECLGQWWHHFGVKNWKQSKDTAKLSIKIKNVKKWKFQLQSKIAAFASTFPRCTSFLLSQQTLWQDGPIDGSRRSFKGQSPVLYPLLPPLLPLLPPNSLSRPDNPPHGSHTGPMAVIYRKPFGTWTPMKL